MKGLILLFGISFAVTFLIMPLIIKLGLKYRIGMLPNEHSIHKSYIPTLGGLGIFTGFFIGLFFANHYFSIVNKNFFNHIFGIVIGSFLILAEGMYDDLKGANYWKKFGVQIAASLVVIQFGYKISFISNPFGADLSLGIFSIPITILWIIGITNAINLIDGLDGLAAGIGAIGCISFILIAFKFGDFLGVILSVLLLGSILAFLWYNFNPARVFMGDVGSQFIGFILACISIESFFRIPNSKAVFIPIIVLAVPIVDTFLAFLRRIIAGVHPFRGDKKHIHHYLLNMKIGYKRTVFCIYGVSLFFGISAYILVVLSSSFILPILFMIFLFIIVGLFKIGYPEYIFSGKSKGRVKYPS